MSSDESACQSNPQNSHHRHNNWLEKITHLIKGEPSDRSELADIISEAGERKIIDENTKGMLEGVFDLSELRVRDIMIPRSQMITISADCSIADAIDKVITHGHSRFPVIHEDKDHIEGILLAKDLLRFINTDSSTSTLKDVVRPAVIVPESKRVDRLLKDFQQCRYHMAIVVDEYGGVSGLVTSEDILELIVGEIEDEYDNDDVDETEQITELSPNVYNVKSLTPVENFNERFGTEFSTEEFDTIGGVVMHAFGHLPTKNETVSIDNLDFKVVIADKRCTHLLQLKVNPKEED